MSDAQDTLCSAAEPLAWLAASSATRHRRVWPAGPAAITAYQRVSTHQPLKRMRYLTAGLAVLGAAMIVAAALWSLGTILPGLILFGLLLKRYPWVPTWVGIFIVTPVTLGVYIALSSPSLAHIIEALPALPRALEPITIPAAIVALSVMGGSYVGFLVYLVVWTLVGTCTGLFGIHLIRFSTSLGRDTPKRF